MSKRTLRRKPKRVLRLPDLDHARTAVLGTLASSGTVHHQYMSRRDSSAGARGSQQRRDSGQHIGVTPESPPSAASHCIKTAASAQTEFAARWWMSR